MLKNDAHKLPERFLDLQVKTKSTRTCFQLKNISYYCEGKKKQSNKSRRFVGSINDGYLLEANVIEHTGRFCSGHSVKRFNSF